MGVWDGPGSSDEQCYVAVHVWGVGSMVRFHKTVRNSKDLTELFVTLSDLVLLDGRRSVAYFHVLGCPLWPGC